jgi:chromosome segregation ATPase
MIKNLKTLIKIVDAELNERRRELIKLQGEVSLLETQIKNIDSEIEAEIKSVDKNPDAKAFLNTYIENSKFKKEGLNKQIYEYSSKIDKKLAEVTEKFAELKKFEMALEDKLEDISKEEINRVQKELDEIAISRHQLLSANKSD